MDDIAGLAHKDVIRIPSTDGSQLVRVCPLRVLNREMPVVVARIRLTGRFWSRLPLFAGTAFGPNQVADYSSTCYQTLINWRQLVALDNELRNWLRRPMEFNADLGVSSDQRFQIALGLRDGYHCSIDKPFCTITYGSSRAEGRWHLPVDQSCIRIFELGVATFVSRLAGTLGR